MDELTEARAELALLEDQERQLLERLRNVRSAIQVQKKRIGELIKHAKNHPISRLPVTTLYQIISLVVNGCTGSPAFAHRRTKRLLASVSRRWRNVILTSPDLWTNIAISPGWSASLVRTHVKRSRECSLDIELSYWYHEEEFSLRFFQLLGLVISCGYRWRSLMIQHNNEKLEERIIGSIWNVMFSSLKRVTIHITQQSDYPPFLGPQHAHTLEDLDLEEGIRVDNLSAAASLKSLRLKYSLLMAPRLPSIMSLRALTICGSNCGALLPESIHLPLLETLTVALDDPQSFLLAIVTPRLGYFMWSSPTADVSWSKTFAGLGGKFPNVQHLCLQHSPSSLAHAGIKDAAPVYAAFPGVRHMEMHTLDFLPFCVVAEEDGSTLSTADRWTHLEHLSLEKFGRFDPNNILVKWLRIRKLRGRPPLQVTLSGFNTKGLVLNSPWLISLYNSLCECCVLELKHLPLTFNINLTLRPSDSDVYGNPPIIGMVESTIRSELERASTGTYG
ncbi:hypothetical protein F5J12DRAFT_864190 [Pisolithus orientalis]|uniref:uncharacterized protein n=1 Tax=Pisolithus orientalis TaxID=936130 RepID=UPI0022254CBA|nr:uncharacterized protein F5J12DRAFT_864190 [Pisolithus orientalis]KAI5989653.1 hypothetical protein F5J12DRAFT_864190 [Pisolithus orientalis]